MSTDQTNKSRRILDFINNFNLYEENQELSQRDQLLSTRIFTCFLLYSIMIIVVFTSFTSQATVGTVNFPSENHFKELSINYSTTLSCLCQQNSIIQGEVVSFNPEYHPICSSQFVNQTFFLSLIDRNVSEYYPIDYRLMLSSHIQLLQIFCRTIKDKIIDVIQEFSLQYFITTQVLSNNNFEIQMSALVNQLQQNTMADHKYNRDFIWFNIFYNGILSGLRCNIYFHGSDNSLTQTVVEFGDISNSCHCKRNDKCVYPAYIYNYTGRVPSHGNYMFSTINNDSYVKFMLPNIKVACFPYQSIISSTFECFYDQFCLDSLEKYIPEFSLVSPLKYSQYARETLINDLLDNLFLESWNEIYNFSRYYEICSPKLCTYSFYQSFNPSYMAVTLISVFGGLKIILFFLTSYLVRFLRWIQKFIFHRNQMTNIQRNENQNLKNRITRFYENIRQQIQTYNMFPDYNDIKNGIYSTRFYILFLTLGLIILIFYSSISTQIRSITINNPSFDVYTQLSEQYSSTLICPCSQISIKYSSIIDISATLHQICSSDFIKDDVWFPYNSNNTGIFITSDFRTGGMILFHLLQKLCLLSNDTITNELVLFNNLEFFTIEVPINDTFYTQISSIIQSFIQQTVDSFNNLFQIIQTSTQSNQLIYSAGVDNYWTRVKTNSTLQLFFFPQLVNNTCSCSIHQFCKTNSGFYCKQYCSGNESYLNAIVPDWFISCSPIDSLSISSLTCFYNSSCVQMLIDAYPLGMPGVTINPRAANVTPLNPMLASRFTSLTKLNRLISELFIEEWIYSTSFEQYFKQCSPNECIYTLEERFSISYIMTTIAGYIGGLSVALRILVPLSVKFIRRIFRYCCTSDEQEGNITHRFTTFILQSRDVLQQMNFYRQMKPNQTIDENILIKRQRIATRCYIILFVISFGIILIFFSVNTRINSIRISLPSLSTFEELQKKYSSTLTCPCSNIAISYSKFVSIQPTEYHQICSSDLISLDFITLLWGTFELEEFKFNSDRKVLSGLFRLLSSFCTLTKNTIEQNMKTFSTKQLITFKTLIRSSFQNQVDSIIDNFIIQTLTKFQWIHNYMTNMFHANQLIHKFNLNWEMFILYAQVDSSVRLFPKWFNENGQSCLCTMSSSQCFRSLLTSYNQTIQIPGILFGCLPIDSARQSTIECFYNSTCLNQFINFFNITNSPKALNQSVSSRFYPISSVTINEMIDELFVETWQNFSNYSNYYVSCSPSSCEYSYVTKNSIFYIITIFLGLYGGLTVGLKIFVWHGLNIYWKICQYIRRRYNQTNRVIPLVES